MLEEGPGFVSTAYINVACGVVSGEPVFCLQPLIMGICFRKLLCQVLEFSCLVKVLYSVPVTAAFEWLQW